MYAQNSSQKTNCQVQNTDMDQQMQQYTIDLVTRALNRNPVEQDAAAYIKREFEREHSKYWHCIVGKHFGR
ncbi:unnamed protein product [Schistocephalus solidus]|uniref:Dynein light chain n=1 Tax=Schistocephalus solidus TaxID=70667 RepID=A0A183SDG5_SCHSO|nr:unnamed protein product [Schistocephalus solidus]